MNMSKDKKLSKERIDNMKLDIFEITDRVWDMSKQERDKIVKKARKAGIRESLLVLVGLID
jgi:hypothetical protein